VELCAICRAPIDVPDEEHFRRVWALVHDRSPGRHTPMALYHLGLFYTRGKGVAQDGAAAVGWLRQAADLGNAEALLKLGEMYEHGLGRDIRQDAAEAARWYRVAADQGHAPAEFKVGLMCMQGSGVVRDPAAAARWYRKAAEQGLAAAQTSLGSMYE